MKHFNKILRIAILAAACCIALAAPQEAQARSGEECPDDVVMPLCSWQSDINREFARWKSKFDYDDCDISEDLDDLKPPKKCTGGTVTVVLDDCDNPSDNCQSSFTVVKPPEPEGDCPAGKTIGPCVTQGEVEKAFKDWLDEFEVVDRCDVNDDIGGFIGTPRAPNFCGGSTTVTFVVKNKIDCYEPFTCTRTFTVLPTEDPVLFCPPDPMLPACLSQAEVQQEFQDWLGQFAVVDACPGTVGRFTFPPQAPGKCGGSVSVTYTAVTPNGCGMSFCSSTFTVAPDNEPPMGTCPAGADDLTCLSEVPEPDADAVAANYTDNCGIVIGVLASVELDEDDCDFTVTHNYRIYDDCGNYTPCSITYSGGDDVPPTGTCPTGGEVASLDDVPTPDPDFIANNYTDNCGQVWAQVLSTSQTGSACTGLTVTHTYSVGDNCGKDNNVICAVSYTVAPNGTAPISGTCPAPVTNLQCWDDVPTAAQAQMTMQNAFPGATAVLIGSTNTNNYCTFSTAYAFSVTDPCTGNRTICVLEYSGQDLTPPAPTNGGCPAGVTASVVPDPDPAGVAAGYTDNCSSVHAYRVGTTLSGMNVTYHYRVYDDCDNSVVCSVTHTGGISRPGNSPADTGTPAALQLKAYPNPTSGELFIEFGELSYETATVTLSNLYGQEVFRRIMTLDAPTQQLNLSGEGLGNGTYLLTVRTQDAFTTQKIVLNR